MARFVGDVGRGWGSAGGGSGDVAVAGVGLMSDFWAQLRATSPARIGLGRAGNGVPTAEVLDFGAAHAVAGVGLFDDKERLDRFGKAGPAGAAVEFVAAVKKRGLTAHREIDAIGMVVPVFVLEGRLRALLAGDFKLNGRE